MTEELYAALVEAGYTEDQIAKEVAYLRHVERENELLRSSPTRGYDVYYSVDDNWHDPR
jgi:hypothetical protein